MVYIYNKATSDMIGEIGEEDLQFLVDQMEEESMKDRDYSITNMEIAYFAENGASSELVALLREALGDQSEVIILWSQTPL